MTTIVTGSNTTAEGDMLWCIHFKSSYYDSDERGPGTVPVDGRFFVLAKGRDEAIQKAQPQINQAKRRADKRAKETVTATIVTLEEFIPARDSSADGRMGFHSSQDIRRVGLSSPEDTARYKLAVCLVPVS